MLPNNLDDTISFSINNYYLQLILRRRPGRSPHRSSSASSASVYFSEVDVVSTGVVGIDRVAEVRSVEDISSGKYNK